MPKTLVLVQDMEDPKAYFNIKNEPKYLNKTEAKSEVKKGILSAIVRQYIEKYSSLVSNIIWGQCNTGIKSVLKGN